MQEITGLRRKENTAFVEKMCHTAGAESGHVELVDLEWQDVPLRWCMEENEQALAPLNLLPQKVQELANIFCALWPSDVVLVPMALGGHVDHRLVLEAAQQALPVSSLVLYEDLPYGCRMSALERTSPDFNLMCHSRRYGSPC